MIKQTRHLFTEEAFTEIKQYEMMVSQREDLNNDPLLGLDPESKQYKAQANMKRLKFLNKFQMMTANDKYTSIVTQSLQDSAEFFKCDPQKWPMCIFDYTYKHTVPQFFVYRQESINIIENYFYVAKDES